MHFFTCDVNFVYLLTCLMSGLSEGTPCEVFGPWVRWDKGPGLARFVASQPVATRRVASSGGEAWAHGPGPVPGPWAWAWPGPMVLGPALGPWASA